MAVTDLTGMSDLPWWARPGPGPTGGPAATPGGAAPAGADQAQWLQYLQQMYGGGGAGAPIALPGAMPATPAGASQPNAGSWNWPLGIGSAQAGELPNPNDALRAAIANRQPQTNVPNIPVGPNAIPPIQPAGGLRPPNTANLPPGSLNPTILGSYYNMPTPSGGGGGAALAAAVNPNASAPNPDAPAPNVQPVKGPLASGGQGAQGATSNPRFVTIDRPNAPAGGSPYGRGGAPLATALNLGGLFGPPQAQGAPAAIPGALATNARPDLAQRVPLNQTPTPPVMPPDIAAARAGRGQMSPDALARAVKKPNWWATV